jgi:hypothetical protein
MEVVSDNDPVEKHAKEQYTDAQRAFTLLSDTKDCWSTCITLISNGFLDLNPTSKVNRQPDILTIMGLPSGGTIPLSFEYWSRHNLPIY